MREDQTEYPEYAKLGIHPDTLTCVAIVPKAEAKAYVWALATNGVRCEVARDADDPKRWHIAVVGGLAYNVTAAIAGMRGERTDIKCGDNRVSQHPMTRS